jgi:hypothetical protein
MATALGDTSKPGTQVPVQVGSSVVTGSVGVGGSVSVGPITYWPTK